MIYSLTRTEKGVHATRRDIRDRWRGKVKQVLSHPISVRIVALLREEEPRTQRDLGKLLFMSNAAVHHHLKKLLGVSLVKLVATRPGPNGITEKLYSTDEGKWRDFFDSPSREVDLSFYLDYTVAWMRERHREGVGIIKGQSNQHPFIAGSYVVRVPLKEAVRFKKEIHSLFLEFLQKHEGREDADLQSFAVTYSLLPSHDENVGESKNILEFEPDSAAPTGGRGSACSCRGPMRPPKGQ